MGKASNQQSLSKTRLEAFSDGVFAIAITLLVLDVVVHPPGSLSEQLIHAWPSYVAYVISFLTIGAAWISHTTLTERLGHLDSVFLRLNLLVLLVVAFLPFPTHLVAESLRNVNDERIAVTVYGLTLLTIRLIGTLMVAYAKREKLFISQGEGAELKRDGSKLIPVLLGYTLAIMLGLVFPRVAVIIYFGIAIYLVLPLSELTKSLSRY